MPHSLTPLRVLVVEDDHPTRQLLELALQSEGHEVIEASTGKQAEDLCTDPQIGFFLVDLGLPDMDGVSLIRRLRAHTRHPIIVISGRSLETHQVRALDAGADDYIVKPFRIGELQARMRAIRRRTSAIELTGPSKWRLGERVVDLRERTVTHGQERVRLTATQWRLMDVLCRHAGRVTASRQILREVWGPEHVASSHYLRVYVHRLRDVFEPDPSKPIYLVSEPGIGYRLCAEPLIDEVQDD